MVVALAGAARADFAQAPTGAASSAAPQFSGDSLRITAERVDQRFSSDCLVTELPVCIPDQPVAATSGQKVHELPASPSSIALFVSAMLSVGAYRVVKQAKNVHLAPVPDWYHAEAPHQVGHAVILDLQFSSFLPCTVDQPLHAVPVVVAAARDRDGTRYRSEYSFTHSIPRAPPSFSLSHV